MKRIYSLVTLLLIFITANTIAEDRLELQGTAIIGNKELPKVLYIVPWKDSELPQLSEPPLESLIDEALAPLDREEFRSKIRYHNALSQHSTEIK